MKKLFVFAIAIASLAPLTPAVADEASAWDALDTAAAGASAVANSLSGADANNLDAIGGTLDASLAYMSAIVGGKSRDTAIESMIDDAFTTMDGILQKDANAADSFQTVFDNLKSAAAAIESESYSTAQSAAEAASDELWFTQSDVEMYHMDLMWLDEQNTDIGTAIENWLSEGMGGMGCP